jgi:aryl-alcohol dehydrogenase-like predicted oxidoreductase
LNRKPITSCITGASKVSQVQANVKATEFTLSNSTMERIELILNNAPVDQYTGARVGFGIIKRGY